VLPIFALVGTFIVYPAGYALVHSLYNWQPGVASPFVGFGNFRALSHSALFWQVLRNEAVFMIGIPFWTLAPLVIAVLLSERVPKPGIWRTILFFPSILSPAIVGILFRTILASDGLLNSALRTMDLGGLAQPWLEDPRLVKWTLISVIGWATLGVGVMIYSSALSALPPSLLEASRLDGASWWRQLWHVIIPGVRPTLILWGSFQLILVFLGLFPWIYVLSQGGPAFSSTTLDYYIYTTAMRDGYFGIAAAQAVVLMVIVLCCVAVWLLVQ
jgi:ABC-type sugar transport system permease subunit